MKRVLIIYYSLTGITEKMAEYIGEGIRISGHEAIVKKTSDITNKEDIRGFDGYIFGSPTHHRDIATQMKDFLLVPRREDLIGKLAGSFGSYTHDGNAPAIILETMEHVFSIFPPLERLKGREGGFLSGGEQQMLAIGRALMAQPKLLLLDEPLLGLSPRIEAVLARSIKDINRETGITILITEQYARPILPIIDYGYVLENGGAVLEGTSKELMENPDVKSAYFGL